MLDTYGNLRESEKNNVETCLSVLCALKCAIKVLFGIKSCGHFILDALMGWKKSLLCLTMTVTMALCARQSYELESGAFRPHCTKLTCITYHPLWLCQVTVLLLPIFWHKTNAVNFDRFSLVLFLLFLHLFTQSNALKYSSWFATYPAILLRSDFVGIIATSSQIRLFVWKSMVKRV